MTNNEHYMSYDPLGLEALGQAIEAAKSNPEEVERASILYAKVLYRYNEMRDRYRLLKASSRQLAEETAWLRDQCDDFLMETALLEGEK